MTTWQEDLDVQEWREQKLKASRVEAESILCLAGFTILRQWQVANGYWPLAVSYDDYRFSKPWWLFMTDKGLIQLGWRKRVLEIDWSATGYCAATPITTDDVTKNADHVHAWTTEKAVEYLKEVHRRLSGGVASTISKESST